MLLRADGGLRAVWVSGEETLAEGGILLAEVAGEVDVIFLVNGLELGVEAADYHVLETVGLYACPRVNLVGRDVFNVACLVVAGVGVAALRAYRRHHLVVFVRDVIYCGKLRERVYLMIPAAALLVVYYVAVFLKARLDGVEQGFLGCGIGSAEVGGALEHKVLKIVCQSGGLLRVVA